MRREIFFILGVFGKGKPVGFWNIPKLVSAEHVAIELRTHAVVAVIDAGDGDFRQKRGIAKLAAIDRIGDVEEPVEIGAGRQVFDEGQFFCLCIADDPPCVSLVALIFHFAIIKAIFNQTHVIALGQEKQAFSFVGGGIEKYLVGKYAGVISRAGQI